MQETLHFEKFKVGSDARVFFFKYQLKNTQIKQLGPKFKDSYFFYWPAWNVEYISVKVVMLMIKTIWECRLFNDNKEDLQFVNKSNSAIMEVFDG